MCPFSSSRDSLCSVIPMDKSDSFVNGHSPTALFRLAVALVPRIHVLLRKVTAHKVKVGRINGYQLWIEQILHLQSRTDEKEVREIAAAQHQFKVLSKNRPSDNGKWDTLASHTNTQARTHTHLIIFIRHTHNGLLGICIYRY